MIIHTPLHTPSIAEHRRADRRGAVLIVVIVLFAVCMALFGLWAKSAVVENQRIASREHRVQAERLAESGVARAIARRAADPQYNGETWSIPAADLGGRHSAEVRIRIAAEESATPLRIEAIAEYPAGAVRRSQVTKHREILNTPSGDQP